MKPFKELTNIDKAKLLHELFPGDINHMLTFIEDSASMILNDPSLMPENWNHKIPLTEWIKQAQIIKEKIELKKRDPIIHRVVKLFKMIFIRKKSCCN